MKEREKDGVWAYNPEMDDWWWTGENEPECHNDYVEYESPTEEEKKEQEEAQERWLNADIAEEKQLNKEKRQTKVKERREAMKKPIAPLPIQEMSRYEQIREDIIKERNEAMAECKFFKNLSEVKNEMNHCKAKNEE